MYRITLLITLLIISLRPVVSGQTAYTKTIDCIPMGEISAGVWPYQGGYLLGSQQWGTATIPNMLRKISPSDSIERTVRFDSSFTFYYHAVPVSNSNIFVFGVPSFVTAQVVNYVIMDSLFNVIHKKQLQLPFNIVTCKFFPAMDGGVIGVVQEVCNESRIFRLDAQGEIIWMKNYVGIIQPPGGYDRTIVSRIDLYSSGRYMISGHLGFGYGPFAFTIDDNGTLINSKVVELFPNDFYTDGVRMAAFNGSELLCVVDNATNGMDTTYLLSFDTALNVLQTRRLVLSDSVTQVRAIVVTDNEFVCAFSLASYAPFDTVRVAICGIDKNTLALNWVKETRYDGTYDLSFGSLCGTTDAFDNPVFFGNYGQMNFQNNGGNNYDYIALTKLDAGSHNGFCDGVTAAGVCTTIAYINTPYYMDTIPGANYTVVQYNHALSTVPIVQPVLICGPSVSVADHSSSDGLSLYPNPTSSVVYLNAQSNIVVTDLYGSTVATFTNTNTIDLSALPNAVYVLQVYSLENVYSGSTLLMKQ